MYRIFASIGAIQVLTILSSLVRTKYIAVTLGPEGTGIIGIIDQTVQLTSFISALSLPLASVKFLSKAHSESIESFKKAYTSFLGILLLISLTASVSLFLIVFSDLELPIGEIAQYRHYLYIALLGMPAMMLGGFLSNALAAAQRPNSAALLSFGYSLSLTVAVLIGIAMANISGYYWATVLSGVLITAGAIIYLRTRLGLPVIQRNLHPFSMLRKNPEILHFSVFLFFASVTHSFSFFAARYSVLEFQGAAAAGLLHALLAIAISIDMVLTPINGFLLTPRLNRNTDNLEKIRTAMDFMRIQVLCMTVIVLPFVIYPELAIYVLFSEKFTVVAPYLFVFVLGQFLGQMGSVFQSLMIGVDNIRMFSVITCICWLFFAAFSWLTVEELGFWGIGLAFLLSRLLLLAATLGFLVKHYPVSIPPRTALLSVYCIAVTGIVGYVASRYNDLDIGVFTAKAVVLLVVVVILYLFLDSREKSGLSQLLPFLARANENEPR